MQEVLYQFVKTLSILKRTFPLKNQNWVLFTSKTCITVSCRPVELAGSPGSCQQLIRISESPCTMLFSKPPQ